jgi:hypothetical protein
MVFDCTRLFDLEGSINDQETRSIIFEDQLEGRFFQRQSQLTVIRYVFYEIYVYFLA